MRAEQVAETAEGNPLFIEELARCLGEQQVKGLDELPTSIRAIIAARLDALPAAERAVLVDASVVGRVFWRGALSEIEDRVGPVAGARLTRGARPDPARGGVPDPGRSAVRLQARAHPRRRLRDAPAGRPPRQARAPSRASSRRRPTSVSRMRRSATTGRRRARTSAPSSTSRPPPTRPGRGWAKQRAVALYREALEVLADDDARRRDVTRKLAVALQAAYHLGDVGGVPAGEPG